MNDTERLLKEIRDELQKTTATLDRILNEIKAYVEFRKAQGKQKA